MPLSAPSSPPSLGARLENRSQSPSRTGRTSTESGHSHLRPTTPTSVHSSSSELGDNDIIPPYEPAAPRTLVLCFDGTGDQFDSDVSLSTHPTSYATSELVTWHIAIPAIPRIRGRVRIYTGVLTHSRPQNSNVVKFFSLLKKDDRREQMVYYQVRAVPLRSRSQRSIELT